MSWAVCVYCASGTTHEPSIELAAKVGAAVAGRGWTVVSGGGNVSMMGSLTHSARAHGGRTVGVIPQALVDREAADHDSDELVITATMRERKQVMDDHADAFLALPGGLGTLEELFETWTGRQLGMHGKPVVLLDPDGHYSGLLTWLHGLQERGFVNRASLELLRVARTVDEAMELCGPQ